MYDSGHACHLLIYRHRPSVIGTGRLDVEWIGKENEVDWIGVEEKKGDW